MKYSKLTWHSLPYLSFICVASLITNICAMALPIYTLQIFDRVITSGSVETLSMLSIALAIISCAYLSFEALRRKMQELSGERTVTVLTERLSESSSLFFSKKNQENSPYELIEKAKSFVVSPNLLAAMDALWSPIYIIFLFILHPYFGLLALAINGLQLTTLLLQIRHLGRNSRHLKKHQNQLQKINKESINCQQRLNTMGIQKTWLARIKSMTSVQHRMEKKLARNQQRYTVSGITLRLLLQASLPATGALLLISQTITPGVMLAALIIGFRCLTPFDTLLKNWKSLEESLAAQSEINRLLRVESPVKNTPPLPFGGCLTVKEWSLQEGLQTVNFALKPGESLAVIGPNGAGKTQLLQTLLAQKKLGQKKYTGKVLFDQMEVATIDDAWLGKQIGYVPQENHFPNASFAEHICRYQPVEASTCQEQQMVALAKKVAIHDWVMSLPKRYDTCVGGESPLPPGLGQRLAVAQALFGEPQLLLFDEADSALDIEGLQAYQSVLKEQKKSGKTTVFVTQRRQLIHEADFVLVLNNGGAVFYGPVASFFSSHNSSAHSPQKA
ncbi:ATP-binding cassette domain-containing protein [bacterium SCSIO 12696]|nr:ATP-binding cassette domain-containing protein [bacterium SCSIO 12696]